MQDKKKLLLSILQCEIEYFCTLATINKKEFIRIFLKVQVLEFLKINFKKEEVLYEIFKDVDPVGIFNYKYICISGLHKDMKKSPKNSC